MPELSIRKIIEKTLSGEIRIPSFQRGFVWEPEKVAFFIDSLYKGYPIGSLLFWRTNIRLENERQLGNYSLPEPTKGYGISQAFTSAKNRLPRAFYTGGTRTWQHGSAQTALKIIGLKQSVISNSVCGAAAKSSSSGMACCTVALAVFLLRQMQRLKW